jgi:hypothetical protein
MVTRIKAWYAYVHSTFHNSEVILWSRLNVLVGSLWLSVQGVDISPFIKDPRILAGWLIFSNLVNELARRRRAEYDENGALK